MKTPIRIALAALCLITATHGSLRLRYSVPRYHEYHRFYFPVIDSVDTSYNVAEIEAILVDTTIDGADTSFMRHDTVYATIDTTIYVYDRTDTLFEDTLTIGSPAGNDEIDSQFSAYFKHIEPGAWHQYDDKTGFDTVTCLEEPSEEVYADAEIWIDSVFEPRSAGGVAYAHNISTLRNDSLRVSQDGYIAYLFGGIRFDETGVWSMMAAGDDASTSFAVDLNRNGVFDSSEKSSKELFYDVVGNDPDRTIIPEQYLPSDYRALDSLRRSFKFRLLTEFSVQADTLYRFFCYYWNHSEVSHSGLFWKRPDGDIERVPARAFGQRKQFGIPRVIIDSVYRGDQKIDESSWSAIDAQIGTTMTYFMSAENTRERPYRFLWNFGDGADTVVESGNASVVNSVTNDDGMLLYAPKVRVELDGVCGTIYSEEAKQSIIVWPQQTAAAAAAQPNRHPVACRLHRRKFVIAGGSAAFGSAAVFTLDGVKIRGKTISRTAASCTIDLNEAPAGLYLVRLSGRSMIRTIPIVLRD